MKLNFAFAIIALTILSCSKKTSDGGGGALPPEEPPVFTPTADTIPVDPDNPGTVGFFNDSWAPKTFTVPAAVTEQPLTGDPVSATITINTGQVITKVAPNFFGNNSNLWISQLNQQPTLVNHLKNFQPRLLRGPAGSVGDVFFFNRNANDKPSDAPEKLLNADGTENASSGYWYGKNNDSWTFSIDGYYDLLTKTNSKGVLTVNYGYARYGTGPNPVAAAAHLAAEWVRYDNGRTVYWEVGNENFGSWEAGYRINTANNKDGQPEIITGALYGKHFKVFADSMRKAATEVGTTIKIGAVLYDSEAQSWNTDAERNWNNGVFSQAVSTPDYYIVHNYFTYEKLGPGILNSATTVPQKMMAYIKTGMTANSITNKPVALTEWNTFSSGSKQNVSHLIGLHAVLALGEIIKNGYGVALRWDLGNGWDNGDDHGLFSLGDEPDGIAKWTPRPAFYHMYYFQRTTGDRMLASNVAGNADVVSIATSFSSGQKGVAIINKSTSTKIVETKFLYFTPGAKFYYYVLKGGTDNGEFSRKVLVNEQGPSNNIAGGPADSYQNIKMYATSTANGIKVSLPARSVIFLVVDKK
jgi:hypothetical protein